MTGDKFGQSFEKLGAMQGQKPDLDTIVAGAPCEYEIPGGFRVKFVAQEHKLGGSTDPYHKIDNFIAPPENIFDRNQPPEIFKVEIFELNGKNVVPAGVPIFVCDRMMGDSLVVIDEDEPFICLRELPKSLFGLTILFHELGHWNNGNRREREKTSEASKALIDFLSPGIEKLWNAIKDSSSPVENGRFAKGFTIEDFRNRSFVYMATVYGFGAWNKEDLNLLRTRYDEVGNLINDSEKHANAWMVRELRGEQVVEKESKERDLLDAALLMLVTVNQASYELFKEVEGGMFFGDKQLGLPEKSGLLDYDILAKKVCGLLASRSMVFEEGREWRNGVPTPKPEEVSRYLIEKNIDNPMGLLSNVDSEIVSGEWEVEGDYVPKENRMVQFESIPARGSVIRVAYKNGVHVDYLVTDDNSATLEDFKNIDCVGINGRKKLLLVDNGEVDTQLSGIFTSDEVGGVVVYKKIFGEGELEDAKRQLQETLTTLYKK